MRTLFSTVLALGFLSATAMAGDAPKADKPAKTEKKPAADKAADAKKDAPAADAKKDAPAADKTADKAPDAKDAKKTDAKKPAKDDKAAAKPVEKK
jgi:hypothetical protein